ncbi:MAG: TetR/AcrR family transcriptional regulator [Clostridium sp.]|nr:TetR/AcrR family transcriptional regulator [Clostridium sp.]
MNEKKLGILRAASKVFSERGYRGASMDEIALEAGIVKGTLYYNFKNKEELFDDIVEYGINELKGKVEDVNKLNLDPRMKLRKCIKVQLEYVYKNKEIFKVILSQIWGEDDRQKKLRFLVKGYIDDIKVIIQEAIEHKIIADTDPLMLAHAFFAAIASTALYDVIEGNTKTSYVAIDNILKFTLKGMQYDIDNI